MVNKGDFLEIINLYLLLRSFFLFQIAVGTVCLSVRLLTTMGTGDLTCIILAVEMSGNKTLKGGIISEGFFKLVPFPKNNQIYATVLQF